MSSILARLTALEERCEAIEIAFEALVFAEAGDAYDKGRDALAEYADIGINMELSSKGYDRSDERRTRILLAASRLLLDGLPHRPGEPE